MTDWWTWYYLAVVEQIAGMSLQSPVRLDTSSQVCLSLISVIIVIIWLMILVSHWDQWFLFTFVCRYSVVSRPEWATMPVRNIIKYAYASYSNWMLGWLSTEYSNLAFVTWSVIKSIKCCWWTNDYKSLSVYTNKST